MEGNFLSLNRLSDVLSEVKQSSSCLVLKQACQRMSRNPWMNIASSHILQSIFILSLLLPFYTNICGMLLNTQPILAPRLQISWTCTSACLPAQACHGVTFTFSMMLSVGVCICTVGINKSHSVYVCVCVHILWFLSDPVKFVSRCCRGHYL